MANEGNKVIYSMIGVSKIYEKSRYFKDIYLSYFYGAKIGVIGLKRFRQKFPIKNSFRCRYRFPRQKNSLCWLYSGLPGAEPRFGRG